LWRLGCDDKSPHPNKQGSAIHRDQDTAANMYMLPSIKCTVGFLHAAAGFPTKDTWFQAILKGYYKTWPGNTHTVWCHFPNNAVEIQKGRMKKQCQNVQSTKLSIVLDPDDDIETEQHISKQQLLVKVINATKTIYTDQTGRFMVQK
jgi:hypothetical protein